MNKMLPWVNALTSFVINTAKISACLSLLAQPVYAQWIEVPVQTSPAPPSLPHASARVTAMGPLSLPFFDDFSDASATRNANFPDTIRWMPGGGAYVNNHLPINQPSMYVVTLDGLASNSAPYDFTSATAQGSTDSLTSRPINLSGLSPTSNLIMSFFWEARGRSEQPDLSDSLILEFKDVDTVWKAVWTQRGQVINSTTGVLENVSSTEFVQALVPITNAAYFHNNFQFRFRSFGRRAGAFDVWHLDYIYLDQDRREDRPYVSTDIGQRSWEVFPNDVACRFPLTSFLKRYTAMPIKQYFANPAAETAASMRAEIFNNYYEGSSVNYSVSIQDTLSQKVYGACSPCGGSVVVLTRTAQEKLFTPTPLPGSDAGASRIVLRNTFTIQPVADYLPGVNLIRNNGMVSYNTLADYYAYDDGTAESGAGINQRTGGVAVQFSVSKPDTIVAVRLHITQTNINLAGQTMVLQIFDNKSSLPNQVLFQRPMLISYAGKLNEFVEYPIIPSVIVKDTFYVGWQQTTETLLPVGLDKNTNATARIFINQGTNGQGGRAWESNIEQVTPLVGSFMVRPVVGAFNPGPVTGTEEEPVVNQPLEIYPNPSEGKITWSDARFVTAVVYDLSGRWLYQQESKGQSTPELDLGFLANGMYLLHLSNGKRTVIKKILIAK